MRASSTLDWSQSKIFLVSSCLRRSTTLSSFIFSVHLLVSSCKKRKRVCNIHVHTMRFVLLQEMFQFTAKIGKSMFLLLVSRQLTAVSIL